jgi:hypothetical protein
MRWTIESRPRHQHYIHQGELQLDFLHDLHGHFDGFGFIDGGAWVALPIMRSSCLR